MLDFYKAQDLLLQTQVPKLESEEVMLTQANQRILAETLYVKIPSPLFDNSAMDGYAISDTQQIQWRKIGIISAGDNPQNISLKTGQCVRIFTGSPIPKGCDAVIAQEDVICLKNGYICTDTIVKKNQHIRKQAEELEAGHILLTAGTRLTAIHIALLASQGYGKIPCYQKISVIVFSNGDELLEPNSPLNIGKIYDANRYFLLSALSTLPIEIIDGGILPDRENQIRNIIHNAAKQYDAIICSGGTSVGDKDYLKDILNDLGKLQNWKIAMKPGKPFAWGKCKKSQVFLLPGNPVASLVTYQLLTQPALQLLMGENRQDVRPKTIQVVLKNTIHNLGDRRYFMRAKLIQENGENYADIQSLQGSHILSTCINAQLLLDIPACTQYQTGQIINAFWLN